MLKYLILDTESGGRDITRSLLTAYFLIIDADFNKVDELYLTVKPDNDEPYIVDAQGLSVNKINLVEHDKVAMTYKQAKPFLYDFLKKNSGVEQINPRLTPVGHAVKGDISRITSKLISEGSWEQFCTYHFIDTSVVLQFLRACGKMPVDVDGSVGALADYFGIKISGELHDAKTDTQLTAEVFRKFIGIINP